MRKVQCPDCGVKVRRDQLARHRATAHAMSGKKKGRRALLLAGSAIVLVVLLAWVAIRLSQNTGESGTDAGPPTDHTAVAVQFHTEDGWTIRGTYYRGNDSRPLIILVHGIGEDRAAYGSLVPELRNIGYNVLAYDSRGFGQSTVKNGAYRDWKSFTNQDYQGIANDIYSAKYYALSNFISAPGVAIIGASVGANEALAFAAQTNATDNKALVLLSPGEDYHGIESAPALETLNREGAAVHIFFGGGDSDDAAPAAYITALHGSYNGSKTLDLLSGARHGTQVLTDPPYRARILGFLADAFSG